MKQEVKEFVNSLIGRKLVSICCEAEILDFNFGPLVLHGMGCTRVIKNDDILITTLDYQFWDGVDSAHNDEWFHVERLRGEIIGGAVTSVEISPWHDLRVYLDNGVTIECLIANAYPHYAEALEQWVLFEAGKDRCGHPGKFLTICNKTVDFHTPE